MKLNFLGLLLALAAPSCCSAFVPASTSASSHVNSRFANSVPTLRASTDDNTSNNVTPLEEVSKIAGSALVALTLSFSAVSAPFSNEFTIPNANAFSTGTATSSSITISARPSDVDDLIVKSLEKETREVEAEAKRDAKKAKIEKSREIFFEYEAKMAEQTEARIEAAEKQAELEAEADKQLVAELEAKEKQAEKDAALATSKKEKAAKEKEARELLKKEKAALRKERKAERLENVYLAEEETEKKIVQKKEELARAEEEKYEAVEKEYEQVAELAKEDELELSLVKKMLPKKK
mmetsp:Transcript_10899/g.16440  ORF Transcript_10899/g.16440 Transcript_10899/m.16440 type:complete len:294 (-) Transcript_10899:153-1034(-)|eukprot:scaffold12880_cov155-Skeletonema_dohrnii-CCMP3373.AAC.6